MGNTSAALSCKCNLGWGKRGKEVKKEKTEKEEGERERMEEHEEATLLQHDV